MDDILVTESFRYSENSHIIYMAYTAYIRIIRHFGNDSYNNNNL